MFSLTWWVIAIWYGFALILLFSFNIFLRRKTGEGLFGAFDFNISRNLAWIFVFGIIGSVIAGFYPIVFLLYPNIINITFPISFLRSTLFEITGVFLTLAGGALNTVAMFQLGLSARFFLPKQKTKLVTSGVYALCRNPIYVGLDLSFLGIFSLLPSFIYLIGFCFFLLYNHFRILQEEKFLTVSFGAEYKDYQQKVGRYLPKIGK